MSDLTTPGHAAVRIVQAADPADEAGRLAKELGADVATDGSVAERLVRARVEAGRRSVGGSDDEDAALLARADEVRAAAAVEPLLSDADVGELRHLAADLGRASRIRALTEARVGEVLQSKVAASTGVALHPAAVLAAAESVADAERSLAAAERAIAELPPPGSGDAPLSPEVDPVLRLPHDDFDEAALERRRAGSRAIVMAILFLGGGWAAFAVGAPTAVLAAAVVVAIGLAALVLLRGRAAARRVHEVTGGLAAAVEIVADTESGRLAAALDARDAWAEQRSKLEAARGEAEELLRVARNRWHQLAGPDADPHRADNVIRAHDPQLAYDERIARWSPTVRTVAAFHRRVQARWRVLWAELGWEEPPAAEELEPLLEGLLADHWRAVAERQRLEEAEARAAAAAEVRRPILLVEPRSWVAPGRLAQLLSSVPPEGEIVLVERDAG